VPLFGRSGRLFVDDPSELFRRYFINTIFDSTFVVLGILASAAFVQDANVEVALGTIFAACLAIGISTGVSVYEAEHTESELRVRRIEQAMLSPIRDTDVGQRIRRTGHAKAVVNFLAPLLVAAVTGAPIVLFDAGIVRDFTPAAIASAAVGLGIIFTTGYYLGVLSGKRPWWKALRMTGVAVLTFAVLVLLQRAV
jgi:predicted membrane protein (TIGR00267 family)